MVQAFLSSEYLRGLPELIERILPHNSLVSSPEALLAVCSKSSSKNMIAHETVGNYLEEIARKLNSPEFIISFAKYRVLSEYAKDLVNLAKSCKTVKEATLAILKNMQSRCSGIKYPLQTNSITSIFRILPPQDLGRFPLSHLLWIATFKEIITSLSGEKLQVSRIWLSSEFNPSFRSLHRYFGCEIEFNKDFDGFFYDVKFNSLPILKANTLQKPLAIEWIKANALISNLSFVDQTTLVIQQNLFQGNSAIENVSHDLGVSVRVLQLRLKQHATSYSKLLEETRFILARRYLENAKNNITDISIRLAYADVATFTKAFKKFHGISPRGWRKENVAGYG